MARNLPYPMIHQVRGGHIYVSLIDIIRDLLGHGRHIESLSRLSNSVHANSPRGQEILDASQLSCMDGSNCNIFPGHVLPIYLWRDGFDPFNVKKNKASAWCMFVSVATPHKSIHSGCNTYLAALGPSKADHNIVEEMLLNDLVNLATGKILMYDGNAKRVLPVFAQIFSIQEDRPEKCSHTYTSAGNSTYHARFGYVGNIQATPLQLPSCESCYRRRLLNITLTNTTSCMQCHDWDFDNMQYTIPRGYPASDSESPDNGMLPFKKITFESLLAATKLSHEKIVNGQWSVSQARCFLATEGVGSHLVDRLISQATKCKKFFKERDRACARLEKMRQPLNEKNAEIRDATLKKFSSDECNKHTMLPAPSSWKYPNTSMPEWVETIMHQLFLGVTKSTFQDFINVWLRCNRKFTSFVNRVNPALAAIKNMTLDFCKAETITASGKFGKYVSENYLAYARLCKWIHSNLAEMQQLDRVYADPKDKAVSDYTVKEARDWLSARNISCPAGISRESVITLIEQIILQQPSGLHPPLFTADNLNAPAEVLEQMIASFSGMVSRIMLSGHITREAASDVDRHIKLFLSDFNAFNEFRLNPRGNTQRNCSPEWLSKYNYITLLNIPDCMCRYGSLRALFEGDSKGEGALPLLKQVITSC